MINPRVSIGIPSYNHEKYISDTITSILNQTFQNFEIIITDDGSSDNTVEVIKNFSDPRIKLFVFEENQGACKAINNCIINSKGEYFAIISSDDVWEHNKLEKQIKFLDENPQIPVVFTKVKIIDEDGNRFTNKNHFYYSIFDQENRSRAEWLNRFFYNGNCICHPSIMIRKSIYEELGLYNELMANLPDFDMWIRLCLEYDFHILDEKLTKFRVRENEGNISGNKNTTRIRVNFERLHIFEHYLKINDIEFFLKVFPDAEKFGELKPDMIPYFFAQLAYETKIDYMQLLALNTLFKFMQSNEVVDKLKKYYNFSYPDFLEMSARGDFFKIQLLRDRQIAIGKKDLLIKEKIKESKKLKLEIDKLKSNIFKMQYKINYNRSIFQRLLSKFPSLYILFKWNKIGFKNTLTNIKGYRAIKKNKMFDIGYYLNKNPDIRTSGIDPILHYIYHGYKEGRNPNSQFDGNYYLQMYPKIKKSKINPLVHYVLFGMKEGRKILAVDENREKKLREKKKKEFQKRKKKELIYRNKSFINLYPFQNDAPLISIIILNRNGLKHLKRLFKNFKENIEYPAYEIIIIDNGSSDESISYLNELKSILPIRIVKNTKNKSFSEANNYAVNIAKGEYILLLNNDIEPTFGWLNEMMQTAQRYDNVGAIGAKLLYPDVDNITNKMHNIINKQNSSFKIQHAGVSFKLESNNNIEPIHLCKGLEAFDINCNIEKVVAGATGAVLLVKKEQYMEVGGLNEDYNYGYEDVDFCLKLLEKGYSNIYCPNAMLFHYEFGTRENIEYKENLKKFKNNEKILFEKWYNWLYERKKDKVIFPIEINNNN